jgi:hypothetical protein
LISSYPFNVEYELGDLVVLQHSIEFNGFYYRKGEVAIVSRLYDRSYHSSDLFDCRILLKCGKTLDCWFGEIINLTRLQI